MALGEGGTSARRVNDLLANSRAEHARHIQNLGRVARQAPSTQVYAPTLPWLLPSPAPATEQSVTPLAIPRQPKKPAGPPPPRSWVSPSKPANPGTDLLAATEDSRRLREELLSFIFRRAPMPWEVDDLPTLVDWCLLSLLDPFDAEAIEELPPHLRQRLVRLATIHRPLTRDQLRLCWGEDYSGSGGEAIALGRETYGAVRELLQALQRAGETPQPEDSWDTPMSMRAAPVLPVLNTLVLVKTPLPSLTLLPRTITHLSLTRCTFDPLRTARNLPKTLPLLEWIEIVECEGIDGDWFEMLDWARWTSLRGVRLVPARPAEPDEVLSVAESLRQPSQDWKRVVQKRIEMGRVGEVEVWLDMRST